MFSISHTSNALSTLQIDNIEQPNDNVGVEFDVEKIKEIFCTTDRESISDILKDLNHDNNTDIFCLLRDMAPEGMKGHFCVDIIAEGDTIYSIINDEGDNILHFTIKSNVELQTSNEPKVINILSGSNLNDRLEYSDSGNICSEEIALFLSEWFDIPCKFIKEDIVNLTNLAQLDIFLPLAKYAPETEAELRFINGNTEENCFNFLNKLDSSVPYLVRTGENNGGGHNQVFYHSGEGGEWYAYDSVTHQMQLTTNGGLTDGGVGRLVKAYAKWGEGDGETSIIAVQATKEGVEKLIEFINVSRRKGDEAAIEKLYS